MSVRGSSCSLNKTAFIVVGLWVSIGLLVGCPSVRQLNRPTVHNLFSWRAETKTVNNVCRVSDLVEREREIKKKETEKERDTDRHRQTDRQTDRQNWVNGVVKTSLSGT